MSVIVTDTGFGPDDWNASDEIIDIGPDTDPNLLAGQMAGLKMIRIDFPGFADGRGFSIARRLRLMGFPGRLRARGHVLADQYAMARRAGFDEIEIDEALAKRQSQDQWLARANWRANDYQARLRGTRQSGTE